MFKRLKVINPGVKVILASGYLEPEVKAEVFRDGVLDFIPKPYDPDEILTKIRAALDK